MNSIFLLSQYALFEYPLILLNRNINHIILCSTFAVCRCQNLERSFYTILNKFQNVNNMDKNDYIELT